MTTWALLYLLGAFVMLGVVLLAGAMVPRSRGGPDVVLFNASLVLLWPLYLVAGALLALYVIAMPDREPGRKP